MGIGILRHWTSEGKSRVGIESHWSAAGSSSIELVVDLANICRSEDLPRAGGASWARLEAVAEAWSAWSAAFDSPQVRLVADSSLRRDLSKEDRRRLKDAENGGWAEVHDYADPVILDHAEEYGCLVLTRDQFVGFRRERPWIENSSRQFVSWHVDETGVHLDTATWPERTDYSLSRAIERDELKALHLDPRSRRGRELLSSVYRCDNLACMRRAFGPSDAEVAPTPQSKGGGPVCQGCHEPLTVVGKRSETAIVKVKGVDEGSDWARIPLTEGSSVTIGRTSNDLSLKDLVPDDKLRRVSRQHLRVSFDGRRVVVCDLDSSNGSTLQRWNREDRSLGNPDHLRANHEVELRPRDRVSLGGALVLERSGRRYPFDLAPATAAGSLSSNKDRQTREDG